MDHPNGGNKQGCNFTGTAPVETIVTPKAAAIPEQDCEQATEQKAGNYVQEDVAQMITGRIRTPKKVIDHVGKILHWPVMTRIGVEKKIVAECFEREQRAFDEWIVSREE